MSAVHDISLTGIGRSPHRILAALLWICGTAYFSVACGEDSRPPALPSGFSRFDSAGVDVSMTAGGLAQAPVGWVIESTPDLVIGDDDSPAETLYGISGVTQIENGHVVVVDGGSGELRVFNPDGSWVTSVGGRGEGPGEFMAPTLISTSRDDSLLIFDSRLRRFHLFDPEDWGFRHIRPESWPNARAPLGVVDGKGLVLVSHMDRDRSPGVIEAEVTYVWAELATGTETEVTSFTIPRLLSEDVPGSPAPVGWGIPFTNLHPPAVVSWRGVFVNDGRTTEIREFDTEGHVLRVFRINESGRPVTEETIEAELDLRSGRSVGPPRAEYERVYAMMPLPDTLPAFASLRLDQEGWLWAERYEQGEGRPRKWVVFDPVGRAHGTMETPADLDIYEIGRDYILGVSTDSLGVERVQRHHLERDVPAA